MNTIAAAAEALLPLQQEKSSDISCCGCTQDRVRWSATSTLFCVCCTSFVGVISRASRSLHFYRSYDFDSLFHGFSHLYRSAYVHISYSKDILKTLEHQRLSSYGPSSVKLGPKSDEIEAIVTVFLHTYKNTTTMVFCVFPLSGVAFCDTLEFRTQNTEGVFNNANK